MVFPTYGVYSGGTFLLYETLNQGFFALLLSAILLKAFSFMMLADGPRLRLFVAMFVANIGTTLIGYMMEALHEGLVGIPLLPALLVFPLFFFATRFLIPTGVLGRLARRRSYPCAILFCLLYTATWVFGYLPLWISPGNAWHWIWKFVFACSALVITLFVTTSYEFAILGRIVGLEGRKGFEPVMKANLIVFAALFLFVTGVLISKGTYPNP